MTMQAMKAKPKSSTTSAVNKVIVTPSRSKESQTSNTKTGKLMKSRFKKKKLFLQ